MKENEKNIECTVDDKLLDNKELDNVSGGYTSWSAVRCPSCNAMVPYLANGVCEKCYHEGKWRK